jgi:hypothetical protein
MLVPFWISQGLKMVLQHHRIVGGFDAPGGGSINCSDGVHMVDGQKPGAFLMISESRSTTISRGE